MRQIPLAIGPGPQPTFANFVVGGSSQAFEHLRRLSDTAAPVYLWGASGATAQRWLDEGRRVGWFDAGDDLPWSVQPGWALVALDRCEALDAQAQHAAFMLFEQAAAEGVPFAAAGRLPPVDLPLRDDLRTRLGWGHVFALSTLGEPETRAALRREADRRGIFLPDEVMGHLLTRFPRDLKHLMGLLDRLDEFALAKARPVTVPLLRRMLAEEGPADRAGP
jgi:DnaA-homolog protein